ncbi:MAG: hypothetical protein V4561_09745 [Bacteroidota bacterium]
MRSLLFIIILLSQFLFFSCKKKAVVYQYEVSTGDLSFNIVNSTDDPSTIRIGPINMDSIIRSQLKADINNIGLIDITLLSAELQITDPSPLNNFSDLSTVNIICLDKQLYLCNLTGEQIINDTAKYYLQLDVTKGKNLSSIFINKDSVYYQLSLRMKRKIINPIPCQASFKYHVKMAELGYKN